MFEHLIVSCLSNLRVKLHYIGFFPAQPDIMKTPHVYHYVYVLLFLQSQGKTTLQQNILSSAHDIGFFPVQPDIMTPVMKTPQVYHYVSDIMLQALDKTEQMGGPQPVTMVCGWHNVGKSTMARYLINTMLSK